MSAGAIAYRIILGFIRSEFALAVATHVANEAARAVVRHIQGVTPRSGKNTASRKIS